MKTRFGIYSLCSFALVLTGCHQDELRGSEYMRYVESASNGLCLNKNIGDMHFQMQFCPAEYLMIKENRNENLPSQVVEERIKNNEGMLFFKLRISADRSNDVLNYDLKTSDAYYARVQYLSYGFEESIALVNQADTIFPALFHFERTYGVAPFADFIMAFNSKIEQFSDFQLLIDDKAFNTGILKFTYKIEDIQNIPKLLTY